MSIAQATPEPALETLYEAAEIRKAITRMAGEIAKAMPPDYVAVALMRGSFIFAADLLRALANKGHNPPVDFMVLQSYGKSKVSSGYVRIDYDLDVNVQGRHVLLIDDILETGRTLAVGKRHIMDRGASGISVATLLEKPGKRAEGVDIRADFVGFETPDRFLVGYGLDYGDRYRSLPYIAALD